MPNLITKDVPTTVVIVATDGQNSFSFNFAVFSADDLLIMVDDVVTAPDEIYGVGTSAGGRIVFHDGLAGGTRVVLSRKMSVKRAIDLPAVGPFSSEDVDLEFDRAFAILQQQSEQLGRALVAPVGEALEELPLASGRANKFLGFSSTGAIALLDIETFRGSQGRQGEPGGDASQIGPFAILKDWTIDVGIRRIRTTGFYDNGDGGAACYKRVGSQPAHALSGQSFDGQWWEIDEPILIPEMHGCGIGGSTDDTQRLREFFHGANLVAKGAMDGGRPYILSDIVHVGSKTLSGPAAGAIDNFKLLGRWQIRCKAVGTTSTRIQFNNCKNITVGDVDFNLDQSENGHGAINLNNVDGIDIGFLTKKSTKAAMQARAYPANGGSVLSVNNGCKNVNFKVLVCEYASPSASAIFAVNANNITGIYVRCLGGQDPLDFSQVNIFNIGTAHGEDLTEGDVVDLGSSSNGVIDLVYGKSVNYGVTIKTEHSNNPLTLGCHNNTINKIVLEDYKGGVFRMAAGGTVTGQKQVLHNNVIKSIFAKTTVAVEANPSGVTQIEIDGTRAIYLGEGDDSSRPTTGMRFEHAVIQQNAGIGIWLQQQTNYYFGNILCDAPVGVKDNTASQFTNPNRGVWENCRFTGTGDVTLIQDYTDFRNVKFGGNVLIVDPHGTRSNGIEGKRIDIAFNSAAPVNRNAELRNLVSYNADGRGILVRSIGPTYDVQGVRLIDPRIIDDRTTKASTGFEFANSNFNYCLLEGAHCTGLLSNESRGFLGLHSRNKNNGFDDAAFSQGFGFPLVAAFMNREVIATGGGDITIAADPTNNALPIGTEFFITLGDGNTRTLVPAAGLTFRANALSAAAAGKQMYVKKLAANDYRAQVI